MAADCHTHRVSGGRELVSASDLAAPLTSLEFHPWYVAENFTQLPASFLENAPFAAALGECGIDHLRGASAAVQMRAFESVAEAAEKLKKPLVIHSVRGDNEIFAVLKNFSGKVLFHGFCHSVRRLDMLLEKGFFVSLAPYAWRKKELADRLKSDDFCRIGFETDDTNFLIDAVVADAARELDLPDLEARSCAVLTEFLEK